MLKIFNLLNLLSNKKNRKKGTYFKSKFIA